MGHSCYEIEPFLPGRSAQVVQRGIALQKLGQHTVIRPIGIQALAHRQGGDGAFRIQSGTLRGGGQQLVLRQILPGSIICGGASRMTRSAVSVSKLFCSVTFCAWAYSSSAPTAALVSSRPFTVRLWGAAVGTAWLGAAVSPVAAALGPRSPPAGSCSKPVLRFVFSYGSRPFRLPPCRGAAGIITDFYYNGFELFFPLPFYAIM